MAIEFRETDPGFLDIYVEDEFTGVELVKTSSSVVFDPIKCAGAFDIEEMEIILAKMKELHGGAK